MSIFTNITNTAVSSGSAKSIGAFDDDCSALTNFTVVNSGAGSVTASGGAIVCTCNTTNSNAGTGIGVKCNYRALGDFDVSIEFDSDRNANYEGCNLIFYVDSSNYIFIKSYFNAGQIYYAPAYYLGGAYTGIGTPGILAAKFLRITRAGNVFTCYAKVSSGDSWTNIGSATIAFATTGDIRFEATTQNASGAHIGQLKHFTAASGLATSGDFLINDSGQLYMSATAYHAFKNDTAAQTLTGSPAISHWIADYVSAQSWATPAAVVVGADWLGPYTLEQLKAVENSGKPIRYHMARITPSAASDSFDEYSIDTYSPDVTPPEAAEGVTSCLHEHEGARVLFTAGINGHDNVGGSGYAGMSFSVWVNETEYFLQADGSWSTNTDNLLIKGTADTIDEFHDLNFTIGNPTWWKLTAWDNAGNAQEGDWIEFKSAVPNEYVVDTYPNGLWEIGNITPENLALGVTAGVGGEIVGTLAPSGDAPDAPTALTATAGDGEVTLTVTAASETDTIYARHKTPTGEWSDESETFKRTGSGDIVVTGLTNAQIYDFGAYAKFGTLTSDWLTAAAVPDDGSNAATGVINSAIENVRDMLAQSATWQTWTESASPAAARLHTHNGAVDVTAGEDPAGFFRSARPLALVFFLGDFGANSVSAGHGDEFVFAGTVRIGIDANFPAGYGLDADGSLEAGEIWFNRQLANLVDDLAGLSGTPGFLTCSRIAVENGPGVEDGGILPDRTRDLHMRVTLAIDFGVS